jgi:hypothetical protein
VALSGIDPAWLSVIQEVAPALAEHPGSSRVVLVRDLPFQVVLVPVKNP